MINYRNRNLEKYTRKCILPVNELNFFTMGLLPTLTRSRVRTHVARLCLGILIGKRVCIREPRPRAHHRNTSVASLHQSLKVCTAVSDMAKNLTLTTKHEQKIIKSTKLNPILPHVHLAMWIQQEIQPHVMPVYSDYSNGQTNSFQVARHEVAMINLKQPSDYQILNPDVFVYYTASPFFFWRRPTVGSNVHDR